MKDNSNTSSQNRNNTLYANQQKLFLAQVQVLSPDARKKIQEIRGKSRNNSGATYIKEGKTVVGLSNTAIKKIDMKAYNQILIYQQVGSKLKSKQGNISFVQKPTDKKREEMNTKLVASEKRIKDLEVFADLLRQKVDELGRNNEILQKENQKLNQLLHNNTQNSGMLQQRYSGKYIEIIANETEEMYEMYSSLSKDCLKLKERENEMFEKYTNICQEKEKFVVDTEEEMSHQRIKIKLLQEALTKRNQEYQILDKKNKKLVRFII